MARARIDTQRVDFLNEKERLERDVVVQTEIVAEGREEKHAAALPGGGNTVFAAPTKIGGDIFGVRVELEDLRVRREREGRDFLVEGRADHQNPALTGYAGDVMLTG